MYIYICFIYIYICIYVYLLTRLVVSNLITITISSIIETNYLSHASRWQLDLNAPSHLVAAALIRDFHAGQLSRAAQHYNGLLTLGMEQGIDWDTTLRHIRALREDPQQYPTQAAIDTITSAGCCLAERVNSVSVSFPSVCPRCQAAVEIALHTFWQCPANADSEHAAVQSSSHSA